MGLLSAHAHLELDVTDPASIIAAAGAAGPVDVLVNNAGVTAGQPAAVVTSFGRNRLPGGPSDPGYEELTERAFRYLQGMRGTTLSAEETAEAIADMVELDDPPLRIPIGADARRLTAERHTVGDGQFEQAVLSGW